VNVNQVQPQQRRSVTATIAGPVVAGAVVAAIGWLLLELLKGLVVVITYCLGAALIVVPLMLASRVLSGAAGRERFRRIGALAAAVLIGVVLCVIAHAVHRHGWLLIVIPAVLVGISRLADRIGERRARRRGVIDGVR
jgi:phosphatidylserine synthase